MYRIFPNFISANLQLLKRWKNVQKTEKCCIFLEYFSRLVKFVGIRVMFSDADFWMLLTFCNSLATLITSKQMKEKFCMIFELFEKKTRRGAKSGQLKKMFMNTEICLVQIWPTLSYEKKWGSKKGSFLIFRPNEYIKNQ